MDFKKLNLIGGWLSFAIALGVYLSTVEPTTSFWDCGEYIATSNKLEVGHPPGAPTFMMIGRVFSMFAAPSNVALMINGLSALCSALTILFLFWTISYLAKKLVPEEEITGANLTAVLGSAFVGAMAFTFSDTFWFSAVEGEVYAMSSFCTALVFWAILRWEVVADEPHSNKWLIFIWYVIGLSIGVHLLNLLAIPAITFVYYFKRYEVTQKGLIIAFVTSIILLGGVQLVLIPQVINIAAVFERLFVNGFGFPFHMGSVIFGLMLIAAIVFLIRYSQKTKNVLLNTSILSFTVLMIGYTSFGMIMIRSNADTPINENDPSNMVNLLSYLQREQYGDIPLGSGQYWGTPLDRSDMYSDGKPVYYPDAETGKYEIADDRKGSVPNYAKELSMPFPRMWSSKGNHIKAYKAWTNFEGKPVRYQGPQDAEPRIYNKPSMGENLTYFFNYQVYWMWGRYFLWNFAGRQNDIQGHGIDQNSLTDGNWASGINFFDEGRMGNTDNYPSELENHKAYNKYYFLPLILGLLGLFLQAKYDWKGALIVGLLFVFTGLAIAVYLNMYPYQPRERDYAFVGSFFAFAIWIGLGVMGLYVNLRDKISPSALAGGLTVVSLFLVPGVMAKENWDDHDRSDRYTAREIARNYLDSCAPNAILFTNGDNDTFPLWYLQEVEGYRTDVRVVNLMLLNTDWYIKSMSKTAYDSEALPISLEMKQYRQGTRDAIRFMQVPSVDQEKYYNINDIVSFISTDSKKQQLRDGQRVNIIPTRKFSLKVDKEKVLANGTVSQADTANIVDEVRWTSSRKNRQGQETKTYILKNEMVLWDLLSNFNWDRPLYFSITMGTESFYGLENYFRQEGFAYRFVPIKTPKPQSAMREFGSADVEKMYANMVENFEWGGYEDTTLWMDENNLRFVTNIRFTFSRLANELIKKGDFERAEMALDRCVEVAVNSNTSFNPTMSPLIEAYYKIGQYEKGNDLAMKLLNREKEYLNYYFDQDDENFKMVLPNVRNSISMVGQLSNMTKNLYPQSGIGEEVTAVYEENIQLFQTMGR